MTHWLLIAKAMAFMVIAQLMCPLGGDGNFEGHEMHVAPFFDFATSELLGTIFGGGCI